MFSKLPLFKCAVLVSLVRPSFPISKHWPCETKESGSLSLRAADMHDRVHVCPHRAAGSDSTDDLLLLQKTFQCNYTR